MTCPFLAYRDATDERQFDRERAYCTAAERFVQPMRADVCNDRYELRHETDCEIYREHAGSDGGGPVEDADPVDDGESIVDDDGPAVDDDERTDEGELPGDDGGEDEG